jgi:hypothetical protein
MPRSILNWLRLRSICRQRLVHKAKSGKYYKLRQLLPIVKTQWRILNVTETRVAGQAPEKRLYFKNS